MRTPSEVMQYRTSGSAIPPPHFVHAHRLLEALRHKLSAVGEDEALARDESAHHVGDEDLTAPTLPHDPRRHRDGCPEQVIVFLDRLAGVQTDADEHRFGRYAVAGGEGALQLDRTFDGACRRLERRPEPAAQPLHFRTT